MVSELQVLEEHVNSSEERTRQRAPESCMEGVCESPSGGMAGGWPRGSNIVLEWRYESGQAVHGGLSSVAIEKPHRCLNSVLSW